jgi:AcrR family transcriptional regulator
VHRESVIDGLRERKKRETRSALAWAAVRLAVERGFANVPVEDIAAGAGVSPRTFNNYFSSKAEAIVARHVDRLHAVAEELGARPPEEDLWTALGDTVIGAFAGPEDDGPPHPLWVAGVKLMVAEPAVQAEFLRQSHIAEGVIAAAIASRLGAGPDDLYPRLAAAAAGAAIHVSFEQWLRGPGPQNLRQIMVDAFRRMGGVSNA